MHGRFNRHIGFARLGGWVEARNPTSRIDSSPTIRLTTPNSFPNPTPHPPPPTPNVFPNAVLPRTLLIKLRNPFSKPLHRLPGYPQTLRGKPIPQKIKPPCNPPNKRLIRVQHQLQLTHQLLHRLHRTPQLPARRCQNHPIIHKPHIKKPHPPTPPTRRGAPTCALLPPTCALLPPMCALIPAPSSHKAS